MSSIVILAEVTALFPHSSVAVKVTNAVPVSPHSSLTDLKLFLHEIPPELTVAIAPPWFPNQVEISNLNRQNYVEDDVFTDKGDAIKKRLNAINKNANIVVHNCFLTTENIKFSPPC